MLEILLFGLVLIGIYIISHHAVMAIESRQGKSLGAWRSALFFLIFLVLVLIAMQLFTLTGGG